MPSHAKICSAMPCRDMLCYALLCYAALRYAMLCCAMPYHAMLWKCTVRHSRGPSRALWALWGFVGL
eukprot:12024258-Karenia_brevis.AAC.1